MFSAQCDHAKRAPGYFGAALVSLVGSLLILAGCANKESVKGRIAEAPKIAVAEIKESNVSPGDAAMAADILREALVQSRRFRVVEKQNMDKILQEHRFQMLGCTTDECAVKLGRILNVNFVIVGGYGSFLGSYITSIRVIDVETTEVIYADSAKGEDLEEIDKAIREMVARMGLDFEREKSAKDIPSDPGESEEGTESAQAITDDPSQRISQWGSALCRYETAMGRKWFVGCGQREGEEVISVEFMRYGHALLMAGNEGCAAAVYALPNQARLRLKHPGKINAAHRSADDMYILTAGTDPVIRLWGLTPPTKFQLAFKMGYSVPKIESRRWRTASQIATFSGHRAEIRSVKFAPDGKIFASGGVDRTARIWDVATGNCLHILKGHQDTVTSVDISSDGRKLISSSRDGTVRVYAIEDGSLMRVYMGHPDSVNSVVFSSDASRFLTAGSDGNARIWDAQSGSVLMTFAGHQDIVNAAVLSPDEKLVLTGSWDQTARLWNAETGEAICIYPNHMQGIRWESPSSVAFSSDGEFVAVACGKNGETASIRRINARMRRP